MARKRMQIKPGRTQSAMGFVVGIFFVLIGVFMVLPMFGLFGLLWTGIAVAITVTNALNAFGKKGVPTMEVYTEDEAEMPGNQVQTHDHIPSTALDAKGRLEQLESLKTAGLITEREYQKKREEILQDL